MQQSEVTADHLKKDSSPRSLGGWFALCVALSILLPLFLIHRFALWFDDIVFPTLSSAPIRKPLFIVGLPRAGTTTMHQQIASNQEVFTTMPLWEAVLAPALCEKLLVMFCYQLDRKMSWNGDKGPVETLISAIFGWLAKTKQDVHPFDFNSPEEDSVALLCYDSCFLRVLTFPFSRRTWELGYLDCRAAEEDKTRLMSRYRGIIARHIKFRGVDYTYLCKTPGYAGWLDTLVGEFPDARFIGLVRSPKRSVASQLSSIKNELALFGYSAADSNISAEFVQLLAYYWRKIHIASNNLATQFALVQLEELSRGPTRIARQCLKQLDYVIPTVSDLPPYECSNEMQHRSKHQYSLEQFGLDEASICKAFDAPEKLLEFSALGASMRARPLTGAGIDEQDAVAASTS